MKHYLNVSLLILVSCAVLLFALDQVNLMPVAASAEAGPVDHLFGLHMKVIIILYVLVNGIMLYSLFAFRRKANDQSEGAYFHSNTNLEIAWLIIPLIVVMYFAVLGGDVLKKTVQAAPDEMEVVVTARQWAWTFEYPEQGIASTELNLPVDRRVHFVLKSEDVTHSFWVPEFRLKQDTVPGMDKHLRITPTLIGSYKVRCAELCGTSHAYMEAPVNVLSTAEFDIWVQKRLGTYVEPGEEQKSPAELGAELAKSSGCVACHSVDGSKLVGPSWLGLMGRQETLADGASLTVDEAYLHESIVDPAAKIVATYANVMPNNYSQVLTESEINALIEYIKTIQ